MSRPNLALVTSDDLSDGLSDDLPDGLARDLRSTPAAAAAGWTSYAQFQQRVCAQRSALVARGFMLASNAAAADDLAQDTIERTLRAGPGRVGPQHLHQWMMAVLRNQFVNGWRAGRRLRSLDLQQCDELPSPDPSPAPAWTAFGADDVQGALATLRPGLRRTFELHAFGGQNYQQIAETVGIPIGTVATRLRRARRQLRNVLEGGRA